MQAAKGSKILCPADFEEPADGAEYLVLLAAAVAAAAAADHAAASRAAVKNDPGVEFPEAGRVRGEAAPCRRGGRPRAAAPRPALFRARSGGGESGRAEAVSRLAAETKE